MTCSIVIRDCRQKNGNSITITTSCSCPFVQRSKIALQEKSLPHKVELVDVDNKPQDFLALSQSITANPKGGGTVPIIIGELPFHLSGACLNIAHLVLFAIIGLPFSHGLHVKA